MLLVMNLHSKRSVGGQPENADGKQVRRTRVLFVCLGNICRSPAAEVLFKHAVRQAGVEKDFPSDSCGTAGYHIGSRADSRMRAALSRAGYDPGAHRARQFCRADFERFDIIIPQDESNRQDILAMAANEEQAAKVQPMSRWFPADTHHREVPDPYYGGQKGFDEVVKLLAAATQNLLNDLM